MKKPLFYASAALSLLCIQPLLSAAETTIAAPKKVGCVDFKRVIEESKYGKREQANFEGLKKQMETILEEKEKTLADLGAKFNDPDYLDSLSPEAENELKHQFRTLNQELGQIQGQYYQTLNQANMQILQQLSEVVAKASEQAASRNGIEMVLSSESGFYFAKSLDLSTEVIAVMNDLYEKEQKEQPPAALKALK